MEPMKISLNLETGEMNPSYGKARRHISDLAGLVKDGNALAEKVAAGNPVVYEVLELPVPEEPGQLFVNLTVILPGKIGSEFHFTKGHFHINEKTAEVYLGLKGKGLVLLRKGSEVRAIEMERGTIIYIPPGWGHRTVNVADENLIFLSIYPADAGHDYERVKIEGIGLRVFEALDGKKYEIVSD